MAGTLIGIHTLLAVLTQTKEMEISQTEAEVLARSSAQVLRHYITTKQSQKNADWVNLFLVCGMIYGPRVGYVVRNRAPRPPGASSGPVVSAASGVPPASKMNGSNRPTPDPNDYESFRTGIPGVDPHWQTRH